MTQPPDDRPLMLEQPGTGDELEPEEQPTIAWTPPVPPSEPASATEGGVGWAAIPSKSDGPSATPPEVPTEPVAMTPDATESEPPTPPNPILSATPSMTPPDAGGWQQPASPAAQLPAPIVGWELPRPAATAPATEGFVIAGAGARTVAYLIDWLLVAAIPGIASLFFYDFGPLFRQAMEDAAAGVTTAQIIIPITTEIVLITLISMAFQYLYFVGFWTSSGRATPGMRGLRMRVVDQGSGSTLSIVAATKRWAVLGFPLSLLGLVGPLQSAAGLIQIGVVVFLFFTVITNDRRQGLHDKAANAVVIRATTSGDGATVVGCLIFGVLVIAIGLVATFAFAANLGPELQQIILDAGTPT